MSTAPMIDSHRNTASGPWLWRLGPRAERIEAAPVARWIGVCEGRVWLTQTRRRGEADDLWLGAGERVQLPAGSEWVVEAWPSARVTLLEERPARSGPAARRAPRWLRSSVASASAPAPA